MRTFVLLTFVILAPLVPSPVSAQEEPDAQPSVRSAAPPLPICRRHAQFATYSCTRVLAKCFKGSNILFAQCNAGLSCEARMEISDTYFYKSCD